MLELVVPASGTDMSLRQALAEAGLPTQDLEASGTALYRFVDPGSGAIGYAGLQHAGDVALLRSVVVPHASRGLGVGRSLVGATIASARARGVRSLWLLTTDAAGFFEKLGFVRAERAEAPSAVANSEQFRGVCPASAVLMRKTLDA